MKLYVNVLTEIMVIIFILLGAFYVGTLTLKMISPYPVLGLGVLTLFFIFAFLTVRRKSNNVLFLVFIVFGVLGILLFWKLFLLTRISISQWNLNKTIGWSEDFAPFILPELNIALMVFIVITMLICFLRRRK